MSRLLWTGALSLALALWVVPARADLLPVVRAAPAQADDELPDGELDLPDGDMDEPEPSEGSAAADSGPADEAVDDNTDGPADDERQPLDTGDDDITPPPDERQPADVGAVDNGDNTNDSNAVNAVTDESSTGSSGTETVDAVIDSPWDEDEAGGRRPVEGGEVHEIEVGGGGGRLDEAGDAGEALTESPLFWGGVGGGVLVLAGAGVGAGFLIYSLLNGGTGSVAVTLE